MPRATRPARKGPAVQIEKRRAERAPIEIRVDYAAVDAFFSEFTSNINEGGLFIATDEPCAVDTLVTLQFKLPGASQPVHTRGRVVWVEKGERSGMGIEFEGLDSAARARINQLVRGLRSDGSETD